MKILRNILTNPIAIAVAAMHWIVVLFAIYGENHSQPFHFFYEPLLTQFLYLINVLPIMLAGLLALPIVMLLGENPTTLNFLLLFNFLTISFQWLCIGYLLAYLIKPLDHKEIKLI